MKDSIPQNDSPALKKAFDYFIDSIYLKKSDEWKLIQEKKLLQVFKETAQQVVAYKNFLTKRKIKYQKIKSIQSFKTVPLINKENYLRAYPWQNLCKVGAFNKNSLVMTSTSGSTGTPFYFPRTSKIDMQSSVYHQMFFRSTKINKNTSVLVIDCFGMGVWIGVLITYQAFKHISERGVPITIITPGINKHEIFQALKNIAHHFDQVILCGYPPFIKDIVDQAKDNNVSWKDFNVKIIFAAEGFSETFRDYIVKHVGIKNIYRDTMNIYGSADLGTMAQETPLSILVRRLALKNKNVYSSLFGGTRRLPTLAQYIPNFISFEIQDGSVCCTGDNILPLVRYEIGDNGLTLTYKEVETIFNSEGINLKKEIKEAGITDTITELPFICIYERSDFSTKLYGAIIYPEYIKKGLQHEILEKYITGKFAMGTKFDELHDAYLEINIELREGVNGSKQLREKIVSFVSEALTEESAEHKNNVSMFSKNKFEPRIIFWPFEHDMYFKPGGKQKWVKRKFN